VIGLRTAIYRRLGEKNIGRLEFLLEPALKDELGGPFNGQRFRQRIFKDLVSTLDFKAIVETGTFRGTTTAFLAESGLPVYTVEVNPRFHAYAALRLLWRPSVHVIHDDTRDFLKRLATAPRFPRSRVFFYLDAHWYDDLPLSEELELIFATWSEAVVMVDDFQVPGTEYGYDDYGPGKTLDMNYLQPLQHLNLSPFFPSADLGEETGRKRGCVVLCQAPEVIRLVRGIASLTGGKDHRS
jgi:hypothetical protein